MQWELNFFDDQFYVDMCYKYKYLSIHLRKYFVKSKANTIIKKIDNLHSIWEFYSLLNEHMISEFLFDNNDNGLHVNMRLSNPRNIQYDTNYIKSDTEFKEKCRSEQERTRLLIKNFCKIHGIGNLTYVIE